MADIISRLLFFPMEVPTSQQPVFGQMPNILDFNAQIHNIYPVCDLLMSEMACIQDFFKDRCHTVINDGYLDQYIACFVHLNVKNASLECEIINYLQLRVEIMIVGELRFFSHTYMIKSIRPLCNFCVVLHI